MRTTSGGAGSIILASVAKEIRWWIVEGGCDWGTHRRSSSLDKTSCNLRLCSVLRTSGATVSHQFLLHQPNSKIGFIYLLTPPSINYENREES